MSASLGTLPYPQLDVSGQSNPLQDYVDQLSQLHGYTDMLHAQAQAAPVGTEYVTSAGMPGAATNPIAYLGPSGPVMATDIDAAHAQRQAGSDVAMGMVLGMTGDAPGGAAAAADSPLLLYHGSPHLFPPVEGNPLGAYDLSKVGTGEGAQVYGHGLYQAERPDLADYYRHSVVHDEPMFDLSHMLGEGNEAVPASRVAEGANDILRDHPGLEHIDEGIIEQAVGHVVDGLGEGMHPATLRDMSSRPLMLRTPEGTEAINHALDMLEGAPVTQGGPTVGGVKFDGSDPLHRAAQEVYKAGGDPDEAIGRIDEQLEDFLQNPPQSRAATWAVQGKTQQLMDLKRTIDDTRGSLPEYKPPGHAYESETTLTPDDALHWDRPFSQQSPKVQDALRSLDLGPSPAPEVKWTVDDAGRHRLMRNGQWTGIELRPSATGGVLNEYQDGVSTGAVHPANLDAWKAQHLESVRSWRLPDQDFDPMGGALYQRLSSRLAGGGASPNWAGGIGGNAAAASEALNTAGVKAIRYRDAGSRNALGEPTHNWVIFDPSTLNIIRRYGIGALIGGGGAAGLAGGGQSGQ